MSACSLGLTKSNRVWICLSDHIASNVQSRIGDQHANKKSPEQRRLGAREEIRSGVGLLRQKNFVDHVDHAVALVYIRNGDPLFADFFVNQVQFFALLHHG